MSTIGIPYAWQNVDGTRTCPTCNKRIAEKHDATGEITTNNYADHYEREHGENA